MSLAKAGLFSLGLFALPHSRKVKMIDNVHILRFFKSLILLLDSRFLRFPRYLAFGLYGFPPVITAVRSLKFQRLRLKEDFDIIVELEGLAA